MVKAQKPKKPRDPSYKGCFRVLMMGSPDYKLPYPHGLIRVYHFFRAEGASGTSFADMSEEGFTALRATSILWRFTDINDEYGHAIAVHRRELYGGNENDL
jgi:hypothetical protein